MGSRPKESDYKPSAAEQTQSRIAAGKQEFFQENYAPLNLAELKDSLTDDIKNIARGRGNADVMQTLTAKPTYNATQNAGQVAADLSGAYQGQLGAATKKAKEIQNTRAGAAVGVSQGQSADAGSARSALTNIGVDRTLNIAKNNQLIREAKFDAGMKAAGAGADKAFEGNETWAKFKEGLTRARG